MGDRGGKRIGWNLIGAFIVLGIAAIFLSSPTVDLGELEYRDSVYFRGLETKGFTGTAIETFADGALKSKTRYKKGRPHGVTYGYYPNGVTQVREPFRNGVSHGVRAKWHENGIKESEGNIVEGKFSGYFRKWSETGQMIIEMEMKDGLPHGLSRSWYAEGSLKSEVQLEDGKEISRREFEEEKSDET